jgi:hypothetical protein
VYYDKSMKRGAEHAKQKFPCNKCKQLGHWAAECLQKQQHAGDRGRKPTAKKNADAFLVHVMGASRANSVNAESWYCDSGATWHITSNKQYFTSYTKFDIPQMIALCKKNVLLQAYGQGMIKVQTSHNSMCNESILKDVLYVPDASVHIFSIKAVAHNSYSTTLNKKEIVICRR